MEQEPYSQFNGGPGAGGRYCLYALAVSILLIGAGIAISIVVKSYHTFMKAQSLLC
jgi:hypothetical protein